MTHIFPRGDHVWYYDDYYNAKYNTRVWFCLRCPADTPAPIMTKWECIRNGGHYWEPMAGTLVDWQCIRCPAETKGNPKDGTGWRDFLALVSFAVVLCILMLVVIISTIS